MACEGVTLSHGLRFISAEGALDDSLGAASLSERALGPCEAHHEANPKQGCTQRLKKRSPNARPRLTGRGEGAEARSDLGYHSSRLWRF